MLVVRHLSFSLTRVVALAAGRRWTTQASRLYPLDMESEEGEALILVGDVGFLLR